MWSLDIDGLHGPSKIGEGLPRAHEIAWRGKQFLLLVLSRYRSSHYFRYFHENGIVRVALKSRDIDDLRDTNASKGKNQALKNTSSAHWASGYTIKFHNLALISDPPCRTNSSTLDVFWTFEVDDPKQETKMVGYVLVWHSTWLNTSNHLFTSAVWHHEGKYGSEPLSVDMTPSKDL